MNELIINQSAASNLERAELDVQITTAKAYPRDVKKAVEQAVDMATMDEETAESCIYSLPRGKTSDGKQDYQKGESVRLAEILMSAWGNMHAATRILGNDGKVITAEAAAWDLEKNVKIAIQNQRKITDRFGKTYREDMVIVTGNAAASIALRNAILRVIPKAFAKRVYDAAINYAVGDQKKISEKRKEIFEKFKKNWHIEPERILSYFEKKDISEITQDEIVEMIGIGTAIKSEDISIDKAFIRVEETAVNKAADLEALLTSTPSREPAIDISKNKLSDTAVQLGDYVKEKQKAETKESMSKIFERNIKEAENEKK